MRWCCTIRALPRDIILACLLPGEHIIYLSTARRIRCPAILLEIAFSICFSLCNTVRPHGIALALIDT